jgi:hypothetical protein
MRVVVQLKAAAALALALMVRDEMVELVLLQIFLELECNTAAAAPRWAFYRLQSMEQQLAAAEYLPPTTQM